MRPDIFWKDYSGYWTENSVYAREYYVEGKMPVEVTAVIQIIIWIR